MFIVTEYAALICNIIKNLIHTEEEPYDKSINTGEEPYIYDFIIVRLINKSASQIITPCQTYWLKLTIFVTDNSWLQRYC